MGDYRGASLGEHVGTRAYLPLPSKQFQPDHTPADLDQSPELKRLHEAHKERQKRFNAAPPPKPIEIPAPKPEPAPAVKIVPLIVTGFWGYHNLPKVEPAKATIRSIQERVAMAMCVSLAEMTGKGRSAPIVFARQVAIWLCKSERPELTLHQLGKHFGGRDHTTILHGLRKIQRLYEAGELELPPGLLLKEFLPAGEGI